MIYFDHNATSPLSPTARQAWTAATERFIGNPSSPHRLGARADAALADARLTAAKLLGCSPLDLVWTSGATEANNAVLHHAAQASPGDAWVSAIEHPSVLAAAHFWFPGRVQLLAVTSEGRVDLNALAERLKHSRPAVVSVMAANNETGVLQPWPEALDLCRQRGIPFACDAAQWIGKEPSTGLGECDYLVGCAHKFGGPAGVGFMKIPSPFQPLIVGGPQEEGRRAGTENLPGVLAMIEAWSERERQLASGEAKPRSVWRDEFMAALRPAFPGTRILGESAPRLWNTVAAVMPAAGSSRKRWVVQLDKAGFAVSTGSACASGKEKPSHVFTAMGGDSAESDRVLRFSAGWDTTERDWKLLLDGIRSAAEEMSVADPG